MDSSLALKRSAGTAIQCSAVGVPTSLALKDSPAQVKASYSQEPFGFAEPFQKKLAKAEQFL